VRQAAGRARRSTLAVLVAGLCVIASSGPGAQTDTARAVLDRGLALRGAEAQPEAERLFVHAVDLAEQEGASITEGHARRALGGVLAVRGDLAAAEAQWTRAEALFTAADDWNALGALHNQRALAAFERQAQGDAERAWLAALAAFEAADNAVERSRMLRNLTFLTRLAATDRIALAQQALELAVAAADRRLEGVVRHQLSDLYHLAGELAAAAAYLDSAVPLLEAGGDTAAFARALTSQGRLRRLFGQPAESVALNRRAAVLLQSTGDLAGAAQALDAITRAQIDMGDEAALGSAQQALVLARRSNRPPVLAAALCRLAVVLARHRRAPEALALLDEAEPLAVAPSIRSTYLDALATVQSMLGRHEAALATRDQRPLSTMAGEDRVWHRANRARTLRALGRHGDAQVAFRQAVTELDALTANLVPDDGSKRAYFERTGFLIDLHVRVLAELGDAEAALEASERGRARAFLDLMATRSAPTPPPVMSSPVAVSRTSGPHPGAAASPSLSAASRIERVEDLLVRRGAPPSPAVSAPEPRVASPAAAGVPSLAVVKGVAARQQSHLLAYWVGDDHTLIWVVTPDGRTTMVASPVGHDELASLAVAAVPAGAAPTRGAGQVGFDQGSTQALRRLHDVLIAPVRGALPSARGALLSIIPHGPLFRVSFAGLPDRRGRYLIEDYRLHYAPSVGALAALPARRSSDGPVVVVADPDLADGAETALPRLSAAASEGRAIARELAPRVVDVLAGREATETRVRAVMPRASVLHFATHGVVSDTAPWTSYLALGRATGGPDADGQLRAGELYDLQLDADLVVLGACRTATGPLNGDGITGLARGFFAAGVPVVVASLWDLPDATTARMQPAFYRQWKTSGSASEALRNAQLALLRQLRAARVTVQTPAGPFVVPEHPSLWAGLIVLGAP